MKQSMNNIWRFIDKHPWIGGMPLLLSVVTLIGFCVYAWYQCALPGDLEGDMFNFLNMGFVCLFWAVKISLAGSLVLSAVFLFLGQKENLSLSLKGPVISLIISVASSIIVIPMTILIYEDLHPDEVHPWTVKCASIDDPTMDPYRKKIVGLLPHNATDVYVDCHPGGFVGGQHIFIRCKVSPDDLRAYIKENGYNFRFDSTQINENSKYPDGGLGWPNEDGTSVLGSRCGNGLCDVDEYWSYNHIYTNNGGYRMFYDVRRQLFYYDWSSN